MKIAAAYAAARMWSLFFLALTLACVTLSLLVNPYRLLPIYVTIPGLNDVQPALYYFPGPTRLFDLANRQFDTLIFGSSRVVYGIDPLSPHLRLYGKVYNSGLLGGQMLEIEKMSEHALANQRHLRLVLLGIDIATFDKTQEGRLLALNQEYGKSSRELFRVYGGLVLDLRAVGEAIVSSALRRDARSFRLDGLGIPDPLAAPQAYPEILNKPSGPRAIAPYARFEPSQAMLAAFSRMIDRYRQRHIEVRVFLTPAQFHFRGSTAERIRREIAQVIPYWDFDYPNSVTDEPELFIGAGHFST